MSLFQLLSQPLRVIWRRLRLLILQIRTTWLSLVNRYSRDSITRPDGPVVSLTTYGPRVDTVYFAIETVARGSTRPSRMILWLDDETVFRNLPQPLRRLQQRGLEVKLCKNYGPHKKYYPYVESEERFNLPLVTADDDVLYPRWWLRDLVQDFRESSNLTHCYAAKVIEVAGNNIAKFGTWKMCNSTKPSALNIAQGVSGVIYPAQFLQALKKAGRAFEECCARNDDFWLHVQALRRGQETKQVRPRPSKFPEIPGTQEEGLWVENNRIENDRQVKATYTPEDIRLLRTEVKG